MTEQPKTEHLAVANRELAGTYVRQGQRQGARRTNAEAIRAGLSFLIAQRVERHWRGAGASSRATDARVTACVLARLGELPSQYLNQSLRLAMHESVDWLIQARTPDGGWGESGDAETTAWAVIALRRNGRNTPDQALNLMRRCRRLDGGFARTPESQGSAEPGIPEVTAIAIRALGAMDGAAEEFLASFLHSAASGNAYRPASVFSVCSEILDCETGIASPFLVTQAARLALHPGKEGALSLEQALLLRCLLRLRNQKAWPLAASLRAMQWEDGSWKGHSFAEADPLRMDDTEIVTTATAVSALALAEYQPGLYFGSDLPLPRRLHQS